MRRGFATLLTLGLLSSMLFAIVLGIMVYFGVVSLPLAVLLVVGINLVMLLVGPWINDLIYRWLFDVEWVELAEFRERSPASVRVIEEVTDDYGYDPPRLGVIPDRNPTAFTYGTGRYNARVVVTEGCFEFLDDDELAAVVGHELGHVTSRDFVIMTLANTIVEILYLVGVYSLRIAQSGRQSSNQRGNAAQGLVVIGVAAYVAWFVGEYMVLYLSRVREYAADAFGADYGDPDDLSMALVKIALGIVISEDSPDLTKATRNLGIMGISESRDKGILFHNARERDEMDLLMRGLLFDIVSPWAKLLELNSTHPLTGKRVRRLSRRTDASRFDFADLAARYPVDRRRLYGEFVRDLAVLALPALLAVGYPLGYLVAVEYGGLPFSWFALGGGWLVAIGVSLFVRAVYRYRPGESEDTTVIELLGDVYASPVDGTRARLEGELIGRGQAGYRFSEDLMFRDETGLMFLKYDSWLPLLGDFLFSVRQVPALIGSEVTVEGWYFRAMGPWMGLRRLETGDRTIKGFIHLGAYVTAALALLVGLVVVSVPIWL